MPLFDHIGAGESNYNRYDRSVTELAVKWLRDQENANEDSPWVLFVGLVAPHFPLIVPQAYLDMYPPDTIPMPRLSPKEGYVRHPWVERQVRYRSEEHTSELQSLMRISYAVVCLKKKKKKFLKAQTRYI